MGVLPCGSGLRALISLQVLSKLRELGSIRLQESRVRVQLGEKPGSKYWLVTLSPSVLLLPRTCGRKHRYTGLRGYCSFKFHTAEPCALAADDKRPWVLRSKMILLSFCFFSSSRWIKLCCPWQWTFKELSSAARSEKRLIKAEADKLLMGSMSCFWENQSQDIFHFEAVLSRFSPVVILLNPTEVSIADCSIKQQ